MTTLSYLMLTVTPHGHQRRTGFIFSLRPRFFPLRRLKHSVFCFLFFTILSIKFKYINTHPLLNSISLLFHSYISPHPQWMFLFPTFFSFLWTEKLPNWSHGPQPCLTQWSYEPCHVEPPKINRSWWRGLTECGPLEKGVENHVSMLALRTPWRVWKGKKIWHWKMNSPGW